MSRRRQPAPSALADTFRGVLACLGIYMVTAPIIGAVLAAIGWLR